MRSVVSCWLTWAHDYYTPHLPHKAAPLAETKDRKADLAKRQTNKTVYSCLVVGPRDAGKTTFCQRFLGKTIEETATIATDEKPKVREVIRMFCN